jgi:hypothetical protein
MGIPADDPYANTASQRLGISPDHQTAHLTLNSADPEMGLLQTMNH